jgi:glyoxylase-like metal-dependent hydrolase (beta-lactamase superfamily II)
MTGRGTNTYVLGHGEGVVVIDPGPADRVHLDQVELLARGRGTAALVLLTHHHPDHAEGARDLADRLGAPIAAIAHEHAPRLDRVLVETTFELPGLSLRVLPTPGHTRDHACFVWEQESAVFAGDLVAGEGFIVIDPPEGDMTDYLASLARVRDLPAGDARGPRLLLPGHGPAIEDPSGYLAGYIAHRLQREEKVRAAMPIDGWRSLEQLLPLAYDDTPEVMYPVAARSLEAHAIKLVREGRAETSGGLYRRLASRRIG